MNLIKVSELDRIRREKNLNDTLGKIGRKYLIMSGKGGVGKTTVAVNLAAAIAKTGAKVGLLDVDLHGPSVASALGFNGKLSLDKDEKLTPAILDYSLKLVTIQGLLAKSDEAVIWRGPKKIKVIRQFFSETAWGELDYLFIDAPPGTGDETMTVLQAVPDLKPIMLTSGSRLAIMDVAKAFNFLTAMQAPAFGLIANQNYYLCPKCGDETEIHNRKAAYDLAEKNNLNVLADLPMSLATARSVETGKPIVWTEPSNHFSQMIIKLAGKL